MASPTERADKYRVVLKRSQAKYGDADDLLWPHGSQLVTPEDIQAGWRVLTPEQAHDLLLGIQRGKGGKGVQRRLALLAGVPGKDSDTRHDSEAPSKVGY